MNCRILIGANQSGSFMGSEFSYEDMGATEVEKYTHRFLRDEPCGDLECTVSERIPVGRNSGYSRQLVWLDRDELRTMQIQYFDRRGGISRRWSWRTTRNISIASGGAAS